MARYDCPARSVAAIAADTAFAAIVPAAAVGFKIRRITIGCVAGAAVPTSQQLEVGLNRATARGTASTTTAFTKLDPRSGASQITGMDTAWSAAPTLAAADFRRFAFNSQATLDLPWEGLEELCSDVGTANPIVLVNRTNALPAAHLYVCTVEIEE